MLSLLVSSASSQRTDSSRVPARIWRLPQVRIADFPQADRPTHRWNSERPTHCALCRPTPTISWPYRTSQNAGASATCSPSERRHTRQRNRRAYRSPAKAPQIAPPGANRTPGGLDIPLKERLRLSPRRTSDAMPRQRTYHSIGEATMTWSSREASSHTSTRGESPRAVRSNLLSTCRRGSDGGSPIASLPELSGSLTKRLRGSE